MMGREGKLSNHFQTPEKVHLASKHWAKVQITALVTLDFNWLRGRENNRLENE